MLWNRCRIAVPYGLGLLALTLVGCVDDIYDPAFVSAGLVSCGGEGTAPPTGRLRGRVYALPRGTVSLPDFELLPPIGEVCMDCLAVAERNGPPGFPGVPHRYEWFGVDFDGAFVVTQPGKYQFRLSSDDGSKLIIDGVVVLNNDGFHAMRSMEVGVDLAPGTHRIRVPYWQGPGPLALTLEVTPPGGSYGVFRFDQPLGYESKVAN